MMSNNVERDAASKRTEKFHPLRSAIFPHSNDITAEEALFDREGERDINRERERERESVCVCVHI